MKEGLKNDVLMFADSGINRSGINIREYAKDNKLQDIYEDWKKFVDDTSVSKDFSVKFGNDTIIVKFDDGSLDSKFKK